MRDKRVKLIYFSLKGSGVQQLELSWGKFCSLLSAIFFALLLLVAGTIAVFTDFYHSLQVASLSKVNHILKTQLNQVGTKVQRLETQMRQLEEHDDDLRVVADLPKIDPDLRTVGVGGFSEVSYAYPVVSAETNKLAEYQYLLDKMERRLELTKESRDQIREKIEKDLKVAKHTPSIRPLIGGMIRDKYGFRLDPFTEKIRHHDGIDIAAERGTEVFATAAGAVERVVTKWSRGRGYGKQVIIDHGYGFKTRYGHLSKILVTEGQKVDRWTPIGLVGDTGRATGPHLHYEVILRGEEIDPLTHILD